MLKFLLGMVLFAAFVLALRFARARDGLGHFNAVRAQAVSLVLVCLLMSAAGLIFTAALER
jgi:hypothetical protein